MASDEKKEPTKLFTMKFKESELRKYHQFAKSKRQPLSKINHSPKMYHHQNRYQKESGRRQTRNLFSNLQPSGTISIRLPES